MTRIKRETLLFSVNSCCVCVIGLPFKANNYTITKTAFSTSGFFERFLTGKLISDSSIQVNTSISIMSNMKRNTLQIEIRMMRTTITFNADSSC